MDVATPNAPGTAPKAIDAPKDAPKDASKDPAKDPPTDAAKDPPKEVPSDASKDPPKQLAPGTPASRHGRKRFTDSIALDDDAPEAPVTAPPREAPPPPVVVVRPAPRPYHEPTPARRPYRDQSEWGFNMHVLGAMMGSKDSKSKDSGMGGIGFILRARPTAHFAIDFGLDFVGGTDYQGYRRSEVPFTINALVFVNPKDRAQFYLLGGIGWSTAHVTPIVNAANVGKVEYDYFGFQFGGGFEFRVAKKVALNLDLIGFVRGRTDDGASKAPEFVDPTTGKSTNSSGGGLLRGGMTVYW